MTPEEFAGMSSAEQAMMRGILDRVSNSMPDQVMEEDASAGSVIASGEFRDADSFHKGSGNALVHRLADGSRVLRLENFRVTNGPALHVILTADPLRPRDAMVDLGALKGNVGSQNYAIPAGVDIGEYSTVLIYCVPFSTPFASAELEAGN